MSYGPQLDEHACLLVWGALSGRLNGDLPIDHGLDAHVRGHLPRCLGCRQRDREVRRHLAALDAARRGSATGSHVDDTTLTLVALT